VLSSPVPFHLGVSMWYRHVELKRKIASAFNTHFRDLSETSMIGNRQGKTEISFDLVEWLSPSDLRDAVQDCPRPFV
jgi:hypothetical protein